MIITILLTILTLPFFFFLYSPIYIPLLSSHSNFIFPRLHTSPINSFISLSFSIFISLVFIVSFLLFFLALSGISRLIFLSFSPALVSILDNFHFFFFLSFFLHFFYMCVHTSLYLYSIVFFHHSKCLSDLEWNILDFHLSINKDLDHYLLVQIQLKFADSLCSNFRVFF